MNEHSEAHYDDSKADAGAALVVFICLVLMAVQFVSGGRLLSLIGLD